VAKISDLGVAKVIKADSRKTMTQAPGTVDFMPPESLTDNPEYGPTMDVFSFAGIILHTFNQQWPHPTELVQYDHNSGERVALSEVERRQKYLDKLSGEAEVLRPLVEECLDVNPALRPTIAAVCERIQKRKYVFVKEPPQDIITLHQQVEQLRIENEQLKMATDCRDDQIRQQVVNVAYFASNNPILDFHKECPNTTSSQSTESTSSERRKIINTIIEIENGKQNLNYDLSIEN